MNLLEVELLGQRACVLRIGMVLPNCASKRTPPSALQEGAVYYLGRGRPCYSHRPHISVLRLTKAYFSLAPRLTQVGGLSCQQVGIRTEPAGTCGLQRGHSKRRGPEERVGSLEGPGLEAAHVPSTHIPLMLTWSCASTGQDGAGRAST